MGACSTACCGPDGHNIDMTNQQEMIGEAAVSTKQLNIQNSLIKIVIDAEAIQLSSESARARCQRWEAAQENLEFDLARDQLGSTL